MGTEPRLSKGLVSATVGLEDDPRQVQISVEVQPGSSGGPLLNERGEVVGMVVSTLNPARVFAQTGGKLPQNVNFASKAASLNAFLRASGVLLPVSTNQTPGPGIVAAEQSIALVRAGIVEDKGLKQPSASLSTGDTMLGLVFVANNGSLTPIFRMNVSSFILIQADKPVVCQLDKFSEVRNKPSRLILGVAPSGALAQPTGHRETNGFRHI